MRYYVVCFNLIVSLLVLTEINEASLDNKEKKNELEQRQLDWKHLIGVGQTHTERLSHAFTGVKKSLQYV